MGKTKADRVKEQMQESKESPVETGNDNSNVGKDMQGTDWDLTQMKAAHISGSKYRVLSTRNDSVNHYEVDVSDGTCSCPSEKFNLAEGEACPHLAKAITIHTSYHSPEEWAARDIQTLTARAENLTQRLRETVDWAETVIQSEVAANGSQQPQSSQSPQDPPSGQPEPAQQQQATVTAEEAAGKLKAAFDEVLDGMAVEYNAGVVWVNKTPDAPDTLPGPGNVEVFEAFLQNADQIEFVHENHDLNGKQPGQYFKNAIQPGDVDDYIQEVLK